MLFGWKWLRPRSAAPGMARNEAQSGRIGTARNEVTCDLEYLFVSAWPGNEAGPVWLLPLFPSPGIDPGALPPDPIRSPFLLSRAWRRREVEATATARRRDTLSAAFSPVTHHTRISCPLISPVLGFLVVWLDPEPLGAEQRLRGGVGGRGSLRGRVLCGGSVGQRGGG